VTVIVDFTAIGTPRPQGSKRAFIANGRAVMTETNQAGHRDWRATVQQAAIEAMAGRPPVDGPIETLVTFALPRPGSHPKSRRTWPVKRPDYDKLVRAVNDSLTHVVWRDDSQIVDARVRKVWAHVDVAMAPGVRVVVRTAETTEVASADAGQLQLGVNA